MNFIKNHIRLFEVLFCVFVLILAALIPIYIAAVDNRGTLNSAFGTSDERYETADGEPVDMSEAEYFTSEYETEKELKDAYEALCKEVEEEGIVLLSNDGALPLDKGSKVSLFGQGSADFNYATSGSSATGSTNTYANLREALETSDFVVNDVLWDFYQSSAYASYHREWGTYSGYTINEAPYSVYTSEVKDSYKSFGDAAIVTIARDSGEGTDLTTARPSASKNTALETDYGYDGSYLSLQQTEIDLLTELTNEKNKGTFSSIIVLLNTSATVQLDFLEMDGIDVDACLWVGNTGSHGALAIGEVLCGDVNPSGKSVDTYLFDNFSSPAMTTWGAGKDRSVSQEYSNIDVYSGENSTNDYYAVYIEGIYVGYRYYETRYEDYVMGTGNAGNFDYDEDVAFPFGHGLSYTSFEYSDFDVTESEDGESYEVSLTVTNTGDVAGKEAVEVYLQKPYTEYDKENGVEKAAVELAGYAKTGEIEPEEDESVTITVQKEQFKSYDANEAETYILDAGDYYLTAAKDSHEAANNILAAKGYTVSSTSGKMTADGDADLAVVAYTQSGTDPDVDTYSTSTETGETITNQFDFMDTNKYDTTGVNAVTYVSRSDWTGTFPSATVPITLTITSQMETDLLSDVKDYNDGTYTMPNYDTYSTETREVVDEETGDVSYVEEEVTYSLASMRGLDFDDPLWDTLLDQMTFAEVSDLISSGYHQTISVASVSKPKTGDENGPTSVDGSVTGYCFPSEGVWAATYNDEIIERIGEMMGEDCIMAGLQGLYAPGVNIHRTGFCGRSHEYFSEDPYLSGKASMAEIIGIQSKGVIAYVKHFAFNDVETNRNGIGIWANEQSAREIYLLPFEYSMRPSMGANSHAVMTSFNRAGCTWTGASSNLLENVARGEWGYDGYYITDMADSNGKVYMTYYDGVMCGTNLYDGTKGGASAFSSYSSNARFCTKARESCHYIMYNVANYSAAMNGFAEGTVVVKIMPWWQSLLIALIVIVAVCLAAAIVFYVLAEVFKWRDKKNSGDDSGATSDGETDGASLDDGERPIVN